MCLILPPAVAAGSHAACFPIECFWPFLSTLVHKLRFRTCGHESSCAGSLVAFYCVAVSPPAAQRQNINHALPFFSLLVRTPYLIQKRISRSSCGHGRSCSSLIDCYHHHCRAVLSPAAAPRPPTTTTISFASPSPRGLRPFSKLFFVVQVWTPAKLGDNNGCLVLMW